LIGVIGYSIIASGLTQRMQCWEASEINSRPNNEFYILCDPTLGFGIEFLVLPFVLALLALAAWKLVLAITSRLKRVN